MRSTPPQTPALLVAALAFGAAGFGFGAYFYLVPYQRKVAQVDRLTRDVRTAQTQSRARFEKLDSGGSELRSQLAALQAQIDQRLAGSGVIVTLGSHRMRLRFPEDKLFDARGPWLSKSGQEALLTLGQILAAKARRVVIAAPMGSTTVPRWVRGQFPTPADLSAARAGNTLKAIVKAGLTAPTVFAVIGSLASDAPTATLDIEVEP